MPIDLAKFDEASRPLEERIVEAIALLPPKAYDIVDIIGVVEGYPDKQAVLRRLFSESDRDPRTIAKRYDKALSELVSAGRLRSVELQGTTWFARPE